MTQAALHCLSVSGVFYGGEARLTGQDVLVSVLALVFRPLTLVAVKQLLGFLFLQALRAEKTVMARSQCMTKEVGTHSNSGDSGTHGRAYRRAVKRKPRLGKSKARALAILVTSNHEKAHFCLSGFA